MKRKCTLLTLLLCATLPATAVAEPSVAKRSGVNTIDSVTVDQSPDGTTITVAGDREPTYSVFKLQAPLRLFIDVSNSALAKTVKRGPRPVNNGVISQVAIVDFSDEVQDVTRIVVGFEQSSRYDVRTVGNNVVIVVEGAGGKGDAVSSRFDKQIKEHEAELERARAALRQKERRLGEVETKMARLEKSLRAAKSDTDKRAVEKDLTRERERATTLRRDLAKREGQVDKLRGALAALEKKVGAMRDERDRADKRARSLEAKLASQKTSVKSLKNELARLRSEVERSSHRVSALETERDEARKRASKLAKDRDTAHKNERAAARNVEKLRDELGRVESDLSKAQAELDKTRKARNSALADADSVREELTRLRSRMTNQDREANGMRKRLAAVEAKLEKARASKSAARDSEIAALEKDKKARQKELAALERRLLSVSKEIESKEGALSASIRKARELEAAKDRAEREAREAEKRRARANANLREADETRLSENARAQQNERARLAALKEAQKKEEARLAELARARKTEEASLAKAKEATAAERRAHKLEKERLAAVKKARAEEEKARLAETMRLEKMQKERARAEAETAELNETRKKEEKRLAELRKKTKEAEKTWDTTRLNTVKTIRFQQNDSISRVIVEMDRPANFQTVPWNRGKARLELTDVALPKNLERSLDTRAFGGTVHFVNSFQDEGGKVHVEAEVPHATIEMVRQDGNKLVWEFSNVGKETASNVPASPTESRAADNSAGGAPPVGLPRPSGFTSAPPEFAPSARRRRGASTPSWQRPPRGMARKRLDIDLRSADVENVLRLFAREGNVNIVSGTGVSGTVTMRLQNVPLDDAFVVVLKSLRLGYEQDGPILRVAPATEFEKRAADARKARLDSFKEDPLEVVLVPINYASAGNVSKQVESVLSSRGSVSTDARTNTLIIKDVAENIAAAQQLVVSIDTQTPQVLIEARVAETNDRFSRELGIQWGGDFLFSPANGNPTGLAFPSVVGVAGAANDGQAPVAGLAGNPNFAVNLPAPIGTGSGGGFGVTLGSVGGTASLAIRLSALEETGHIKIISQPKILTLDNRPANITQGTSIPISVVSAAGVQTVFVDAALDLSVTPHVTQDGNVLLTLSINKSEPDFENTGARGDPTILRRAAKTELLLADGDTTVVGGIYTQSAGTSASKVPWLGDIPVLGFFFRDYSENENRTELLIFVTPRIVNREAALTTRRLSPITAPEADSKKN